MCTGISLTSKEQHYYWGRTQEFDMTLVYAGLVIPRNYTVDATLSKITSVYAAAGIGMEEYPVLVDGVNEKGLAGGSFYFANYQQYASEADIKAANKLALRGQEFVTWALLNCGSVAELKERANLEVAIADVENSFPQHYVFQDTTGASIVIEPSIKNGFKIFDNTVGIFTNNPPFDWHLTHLQQFVGLSDTAKEGITIGQETVFSPGKGSGLIGIPGDFTPASRFVRATFLKHLSETVNDQEVINHLFHLLNTSDIPKGVVKTTGSEGKQYTQYTSAYDLEKGLVYFHHYDNRAIQTFGLNEETMAAHSMALYQIAKEQTIVEMKLK